MSDHIYASANYGTCLLKLTMGRGRSILNFVALRLLANGTIASYFLSESCVSYISWEEKLVSSITTNFHFIFSIFSFSPFKFYKSILFSEITKCL